MPFYRKISQRRNPALLVEFLIERGADGSGKVGPVFFRARNTDFKFPCVRVFVSESRNQSRFVQVSVKDDFVPRSGNEAVEAFAIAFKIPLPTHEIPDCTDMKFHDGLLVLALPFAAKPSLKNVPYNPLTGSSRK